MKIITWNCNMAFRKKAAVILQHKPDILIVPECEHPDKLNFPAGVKKPTCTLWFGDNLNKGLGIFSYGHFNLRQSDSYNPVLRLIVPVTVTNRNRNFVLYAIWAYNPKDPDGTYVEQVWKAIDHYDQFITDKLTLLIGDFNSNTMWDKKRRISNHSNVVKRLEEKGILSCYHVHHKQEQGKELHPTYYLYRHKDRPYHLDYCFASKDIIKKIRSVEIGEYHYWSAYSDHVPLIITFK